MAKVRKSKPDYQGFLAIFDKKWTKSMQKWPKINGIWAIFNFFQLQLITLLPFQDIHRFWYLCELTHLH